MRTSSHQYSALKDEYITSWHTWNVRSVLSYVHMPDGLALNLMIKEYQSGNFLTEALIGRFGDAPTVEKVFPGEHAFDGSYTSLVLEWCNMRFRVETCIDRGEFLILVTPESISKHPALLVLDAVYLWNRPGCARGVSGDMSLLPSGHGHPSHMYAENADSDAMRLSPPVEYICADGGGFTATVRTTSAMRSADLNIPARGPALCVPCEVPVGFYTGNVRSLDHVQKAIARARAALLEKHAAYGDLAGLYGAMECALSWDTIYDPQDHRAISPVSRLWSLGSGGSVLFCWDNLFAGFMASYGSRELSYSNLIEIVNELTEDGFVPNFSYGTGQKSRDRSQPPVGSAMALMVYNRFGEKWLLEQLYPSLLSWNTWFWEHRRSETGALCWGSDPITPIFGNYWETAGVNDTLGGALESGLDNSPMYDGVPFDKDKHVLCQEDVGLTGLYIRDCDSLSAIARLLGKDGDAEMLDSRMSAAENGLEGMWDEEFGFYCNRRTDTGKFNRRISPCNFYALFSKNVPTSRIGRLIEEHYKNPDEFYGEWMLPSIARNDPAFHDNDYWRGRIWAPLNFLTYLAFCNHGLDWVCRDLAAKSEAVFRKEWEEHRHVHENYNSVTGEGCDAGNSDKFYHWGALMVAIAIMERKRQQQTALT